MIHPSNPLSIVRQVRIVENSRSSVNYAPRPMSRNDLKLIKAIDRLHLETPYARNRCHEETSAR